MDKIEKIKEYQTIIQQVLKSYVSEGGCPPEIEMQLVFDLENNHYQVVSVGWKGEHRIHGMIIHIDIRDGKIWIQHNGTESDLGHIFLAAGVPKSDIVLGFQSPFKRQFTEFAVG